jgi:phage terminase large subunit-like protein
VSYVERARTYAQAVVSGEIPACLYVRQACQRQLDDLAQPPRGFRFDKEKAGKVCQFIELVPHIKGPAASRGETIRLEPWQVFILTTCFGWVDEEGNRRFRRIYIEVPRGNGKSSLSSPVGLYMTAFDGEAGAEVYSAATTRDQARIVFRDAQAMARRMPKMLSGFGIEVTAQAIVQMATASSFKALSADAHTLDGLNIHLAIVDELHAHKTPEVYEVLETGLGKRPQSMLWAITTAGFNRHGICYQTRDYALKVLSGDVTGEAAQSTFGIIYTIDEGDDPFTEETLRKANPNWGVSVDPEFVLQMAAKARQVVRDRNNYLTKHLNVWVDANSALYDTQHWRRCEDKTLNEGDFAADECVIGLDLASKIDIAARVNLYRREVDGKAHYYVFPRFYLPRVAIEEDRHPMYRGWELQGDLIATPGETTDFSVIEDDIRAEGPGLNLSAVATDPWQARQMIQSLQKDGMPAEEYRQVVQNMSEATKTLDALMREGRIHHPGNAVLNWMIGNVVGHYDTKENVYPRKEMTANKIDGAVALIMALGWFLGREAKPEPEYQMIIL